MFLTKKALFKIWFITITYAVFGVIWFLMPIVHTALRSDSVRYVVFGIIFLLLSVFFYKWGRFAEGKGKLLSKGKKLIHYELRPAEFIRLYEESRDCPDNVISKPDFDVLWVVLSAYDVLDDVEREFEALEHKSIVAPEKKKPLVKILKASMLFDKGRTEEAESLYFEVLNGKKDLTTMATLDVLAKCDRAKAMGDYATAEAYYRQKLIKSFPKNTPLDIILARFSLAEICCKTDRKEEAKEHFNYCVENGGETSMASTAREMLEKL